MKPERAFDCVEMKHKAQERIYEETKDLSREEFVVSFRCHAGTGPFGQLWRQPKEKPAARHRTKS